MPTVKTDVLIIAHPSPGQVAIGASFAADLPEARERLERNRFAVVAFASNLAARPTLDEFLDFLDHSHPQALRVLLQKSPAPELTQIINRGQVFSVLPDFHDPEFEAVIHQALEKVRLDQQNDQLLSLIQEQNESLQRLSVELEDRVQKRQSFLLSAREKLVTSSERQAALHRTLVAVHRASSIGEMERLLLEALAPALQLTWVRIHFRAQTSGHIQRLAMDKMYALFQAEINSDQDVAGEIFFARTLEQPFNKDEKSFLRQVTDAVALAVDRIAKLEILENLKTQWQATFDSISHPLSLVDDDFVIYRMNRAFVDQTGLDPAAIVGRRCYETLFARTSPCEGCELGQQFRLPHAKTRIGGEFTYQVTSSRIRLSADDRPIYVVMYHDVTDQQRLERQILESAKLAELGTIGSSIAHEINNPLGGMISFLQLIKMDLKGDEPYYADIVQMEDGVKRSGDIVRNLLGFTRKSTSDEIADIDFRDVIERSLKITELQTRSKGIQVKLEMPDFVCVVRGQANLLSQAICNVLQNSAEAIQKRARQEGAGFHGEMHVALEPNKDSYRLEISDNGVGIPSEFIAQVITPHYSTKGGSAPSGLGLTVAHQIIVDHSGQLEISSAPGRKTVARISIPRPVF